MWTTTKYGLAVVVVPWPCAPGAEERMISEKASQRRWSQGVSPSEGTARARASRQARVSAKDSGGSCTLMVRNASLKRR